MLMLEVVCWELFVQFWGGQPSAALHGIVAVLSAVSPACLQGHSVYGGFGGLVVPPSGLQCRRSY